MWIISKLSKACREPGEKDYEALLWTLGYFRAHKSLAIKVYSKTEESEVHKICIENKKEMTEITGFSDSSWQDFPDTGRSTIGYKIFLNEGLVEWGTSATIPIAMSSEEEEYMAACTACMSMAHIKVII